MHCGILIFSYPQQYMELSDRKLQPKDVPGTLLNIALFNLCGSDVVQRAAAYQLLCAVKESFQLLPDTKLLSTAQGVICVHFSWPCYNICYEACMVFVACKG